MKPVLKAIAVLLGVTLAALVVAGLGWALVNDSHRAGSLRAFANRCEAAGGLVRYQHVDYDEGVRLAWCWTPDRSRLIDQWRWTP